MIVFTQNSHNNHMHEDISRPFYILTVNSFMNFHGSAEVYFHHRRKWLPSGIVEIPSWDKAEDFHAEKIRIWPTGATICSCVNLRGGGFQGTLGIIQLWVYVLLGLNSVNVSDFQALMLIVRLPLRYVYYMLLNTHIINNNQVNLNWSNYDK